LNRLVLGTAQFGLPYGVANKSGQVSRAEAMLMLRIASQNFIDTIDTAITYGESEECLGSIGLKDFKVVTKLPSIQKDCLNIGDWVHDQVKLSLSRLGLGQLYGLLIHNSEDLLGPNGSALYRGLDSLKEKGIVKKIGVSIYSPNELESLTKDFSFDLIQAPFNLIDQRLLQSGWMKKLKDNGVEIHARSAFLQGLLLMKEKDIPAKFSPWRHLWKIWHLWLTENKVSALQASLAFSLSCPEIDRVVVGADSHDQLVEIINSTNILLNVGLPNLICADENLINPTNWPKL
jgi:aryl-alcohol dehydrogenase-like predicted oxidoreductase